MKAHDVYSYGVVSSSTLYGIRGAFPGPEGYAEIDDVRYMTGGEATNSSIVLSRLGARVKLDGNHLGADEGGKRTKALLSDYRIDTSRLPLIEGYEGVREVVFAAEGTRTIFGTYCRLLEEAQWNLPQEDDITAAKVVCLDPFFEEASSRVAEIACDADIPVVTVDCSADAPLLRQIPQWSLPNRIFEKIIRIVRSKICFKSINALREVSSSSRLGQAPSGMPDLARPPGILSLTQ